MRRVFLLLTVCLLSLCNLKAQHPFSTKWRVIKNDRLKIIYPEGLDNEALRLRNGITAVFQGDTLAMKASPRRVPLVLSTTSVTSNGYATLFPYHLMFYSKPMDDCSLASTEWIEALMTHEYRHIVQYDVLDHGFTRFASCLFGAYGRSTLSYSVPQWFYEGDAVFAETVLTSQGRGRAANFDRAIAAVICGAGKDFGYDKMLLRSYRDFLPSHYPFGYMLVTKARRDFGEEIFNKAIRRSNWYSFMPYAFSIGFKHYSGISLSDNYKNAFSELKTFYSKRMDSVKAVDYKKVNTLKKRYYTNYNSPRFISDTSIVCIKSSMSKSARFVEISLSGKERVLQTTDADEFDTDGKILVYASKVPDLRWTLRDYSDIAVYDLKTGKKQLITKKQKYFSPALSPDSKKIAVVEFSQNRICKVVILSLERDFLGKYKTSVLKCLQMPENSYVRGLEFLDSDTLVYVVNVDNKNSVKMLAISTLTEETLVQPTQENISGICTNDNKVFYISDVSGVENIYEVSGSEIRQITNSKYGVSDPDIRNNKLIFSDFGFKGNDIAISEDLGGTERNVAMPLNYFAPVLEKNPRQKVDFIATLKNGERTNRSRYYSPFSDPIRIYGWIPNSGDGYVQGTVYSQNTLGTLFLNATGTYDTDKEFFRTDINCLYTGFYPEIQFNASLGDNADYYAVKMPFGGTQIRKFAWKENIYSLTFRVPFDFSRFENSQKLSVSTGISLYSVSDKIISNYDDMGNGDFPVLNGGLNYSWSKPKAYRDFKNPLSVDFSFGLKKSADEKLDAEMFSFDAALTVPGFCSQNYFTLKGNFVRQTQNMDLKKIYLFSNDAFNIGGYSSFRLQKLYKIGGEYELPLGYPDFGIPALIWFKRFRGSVFGEVARGELLGYKFDFASLGAKFLTEFHLLRLQNVITMGFSYSYGLKANGFEKPSEFNLILMYQM
ncbi:MAG: hypothetical protein IKO99_15930 [Bacteroidales bacterium]|nr:hypothetical protein [Bacteroidales bacterium]